MSTLKRTYTPRDLSDFDNLNVKSAFPHPYFLKRENLSILYKNYLPKDGDFYVATYPKSGTTWTIKIVEHLLASSSVSSIGGGLAETEALPWFECTTVPHMREGTQEEAVERANSKEKRMWKSHSSVGLLPKPAVGKLKVVVTSRHPLDIFVSAWHHARRDADFGFEGSFEEFFRETCLTGDYISGHFLEYQEDYLKASESGEIDCLFLKYEDMKTPEGAILGVHKLAKFMGIEDYDAAQIADDTSFKSMKNLSKKGFVCPKPDESGKIVDALLAIPIDHSEVGTPEKHSSCHIRKGESGGWVEYMNAEDLVMWREYVKSEARRCPRAVEFLGLDFLLAEHIQK